MSLDTKEKINEVSLAKVASRLINNHKWDKIRDLFERLYGDKRVAETDAIKMLLEKIIEYYVSEKKLGYARLMAQIAGRKLNKDEVLPEIKEYLKVIKTNKTACKYMLELFTELDDYDMEIKYLRKVLKIIIQMEINYKSDQHDVSYELRYNFFIFILAERYNKFLYETFKKLFKKGLYDDIECKIIKYLEGENKNKFMLELYNHFTKMKIYDKQLEYAEMLGIKIPNEELIKMINNSVESDRKFALELIEKLPDDFKIKQISNLEKIYEYAFSRENPDYQYIYYLRSFIDEIALLKSR